MPNNVDETPAMREGECPFCERTVLVYEDPPRCPLCACPLEEVRTRPYSFPEERPDSFPEERPASAD